MSISVMEFWFCSFCLLAACLALSGCGLVAVPFRVTGDIVQVVLVVGKPLGEPIHAVGDAID